MTADMEAPRKGRSNAILTYETVEEIKLGVQEALLEIRHLGDNIKVVDDKYVDHEARIRVLEAAHNARTGGSSMAAFLYGAVWPAATVIIAAIALFMN